jgi:hypothetical protein
MKALHSAKRALLRTQTRRADKAHNLAILFVCSGLLVAAVSRILLGV